jgi:hypothetical protein
MKDKFKSCKSHIIMRYKYINPLTQLFFSLLPLLLVMSIGLVICGYSAKIMTFKDLFTSLIAIIGLYYTLMQEKLRKLELQSLLSYDFNEKYVDIEEDTEKLRNKQFGKDEPLSPEEKQALNSYIDLCSEEFYYYYKGIIDEVTWNTWFQSMKDFLCDKPLIRDYAKQELKRNLYYGFGFYMGNI